MMKNDVLAPYRRPGATPAVQPEAEPTSQAAPPGYVAFGVAPGTLRPQRLDIRSAGGLAVARHYSALSEIAYDRNYTGLLLLWPAKLVTIKGRNLKPLVEALLAGTAEYLAELAEGEIAPPDAPVITHMTTAIPKPAAKGEGG